MQSSTSDKHHHGRRGRGFRNPWPSGKVQGIGGVLRWLAARALGARPVRMPGDAPTPYTPPEHATPSFATPRAGPDAITATWVGHSTFLLQIGGLNVLTDPMWGERASPVTWAGPKRWTRPGVAVDQLPPIDVVVQSHNHYDHLDAGTVRRLVRDHPAARWVAPLGVGRKLGSLGAGAEELDWWETTRIPLPGGGELEITGVPAQHFSGRGVHDRNRTLWCGWVLRVTGGAAGDVDDGGDAGDAADRGRAVYFVGDTGLHPDFARVGERCGPFDLVLMPVGAYDPRWFMRPVHVAPEEAVSAFRAVVAGGNGGRRCVMGAMHWGTFKLTDEPMDEPPQLVRVAWMGAGLPPDDLWVPELGETLTR